MIIQYTKEFNAYVAGAVQFLNNKNSAEAVRYLKASLKTESKIQELYQEMKSLEKDLRKLTKKNIKYLKKEKNQSK